MLFFKSRQVWNIKNSKNLKLKKFKTSNVNSYITTISENYINIFSKKVSYHTLKKYPFFSKINLNNLYFILFDKIFKNLPILLKIYKFRLKSNFNTKKINHDKEKFNLIYYL